MKSNLKHMERVLLIDSGHGGMVGGVYQTAPHKMHLHQNGDIAYEGVLNREVKAHLLRLLTFYNIRYIDVCPTDLDIDLDTRVDVINSYCDEFGSNNCLLISLHSNAGGGEGFEIWTSPGATKSDIYATAFMKEFKTSFPDIRIRKDESDGDVDKESSFYILVNTKCPAIMPEWLFFDNIDDFKIQRDPAEQKKYAEMIVRFAKNI
jgi:N-acetylmuramoyl-L-alanine amidase